MRRGPTEVGGTACSFTEKITNAANAGAIMVVVANNQVGSISMDTTGAPNVPAYSIDKAPGDALITFVGANEATATVDTAPSGIGNVQGDVLANFSYRGPTLDPYSDETKPDIAAPGVNIYAALDDQDGNYGLDERHLDGDAAHHGLGRADPRRASGLDADRSEVRAADDGDERRRHAGRRHDAVERSTRSATAASI